ncbi:MAG: hypothetical protein WCO56_28645, partial [Verrucomicrobiota bacterium]
TKTAYRKTTMLTRKLGLEQILKNSGVDAKLAPKGLSGHDITIAGQRFSLKTQADKNILGGEIWISKFMELGKGIWGDNPADLGTTHLGNPAQFLFHATHNRFQIEHPSARSGAFIATQQPAVAEV